MDECPAPTVAKRRPEPWVYAVRWYYKKEFLNITLEEDVVTLGDVVVVGYGTQKKESLTGSISNLKVDEITKTKSASLAQAIQGKVAGLQIRQENGEPGQFSSNINIRGLGTPLFIIDGIVRDGSSEFQRLNPEDIESISFLKDATAAIYGMNSANGAIIVTTKKGKQGKTRITLNTNVGISSPTDIPQMANAGQYMTMRNEAEVNAGRPPYITQEELLKLIDELNNKSSISGILVQLPVPKHIDEKTIINAIAPNKDVDAFHPVNVGKIMVGNYDFVPCTPAGVMELIKESGIDVSGKECVIVGRSNIVGKPQAMLLLHQNGTVTICHSKTKNLAEKTKNADILVAAVGIPNFIKGDMIKEGAVVIDVGINRLENKKLCGDVEFESAEKVAGAITPVPGGVGPMTIAMLMKNTVKAAILNKSK